MSTLFLKNKNCCTHERLAIALASSQSTWCSTMLSPLTSSLSLGSGPNSLRVTGKFQIEWHNPELHVVGQIIRTRVDVVSFL